MALIHIRMLGYVITLAVHITNLAVMGAVKRDDVIPDIRLKRFGDMMYRYFTCWTVMLQILYAALGLCCDLLTMKNSKNKKYKLPNILATARNIMFSALVWPCSMMVCTVFWSLFLYDRSLIFPEFIDKVISKTSNHIIHTAIVPIALWEVFFRAMVRPKSDVRNLVQLVVHMVVYLIVFYYTYINDGIFLYPIFKVTYGSIHFLLLHVYIAIILLFYYYLQWFLNYLIHGSQDKIKKNK